MDRETLEIVFTKIRGIVGNEVGYVVRGRQRWRGYTKPVQPDSAKQLACRGDLTRLVGLWHGLSAEEKAAWSALARERGRKRVTGFNVFLGAGLKKLAESRRQRELKRVAQCSSRGPREVRRFVRSVRPDSKFQASLCPTRSMREPFNAAVGAERNAISASATARTRWCAARIRRTPASRP
jgi:hypothetical protein